VEWQVDYEWIQQDGKTATDFEVGRSEKVGKPFMGIADRN
jgi:hypothetical protein